MKYSFLFFIFIAVSALAQKPELYILSVGVEKYKDTRLNLNYCVDDARDLAAAWKEQTSLFDIREVKVLTDQQATRNNVRQYLDYLKKEVTDDDLFIFIFSGHGMENALVTHDFDRNDTEASSLSKTDLKQKISALGCSYMLFIDACHSGSFTKSLYGKDITDFDLDTRAAALAEALTDKDKPNLVFSSSGSDQVSFECSQCGHGYFAQTILDAFQNKKVSYKGKDYYPDANGDGSIDPYEMERYIKEATRIRTINEQNPQKVKTALNMGRNFPLCVVQGTNRTTTSPPRSAISDRDADGIPDNQDSCPDAYGTRANGGCPTEASGTDDYDGDGVADSQDPCPTEKGTANGCPDSDGDGVPDKSDKCRSSYGRSEWEGCPDSDGDGLPDHKDNCPREYGTKAYNGCPPPKPVFADYTDNHDGIGMQMVAITGGSFTMGCTAEQGSDCEADEKPAHKVTLSDYYIGKYEVTQRQWKAVMGSYPTELFNTGCDGCPVERVSWDDVQVFIKKLNEKTGKAYRLPTEAEWEYAARGGQQYKYSGSNSIDEVAWYESNYAQSKTGNQGTTHPVGQKKANGYGLYDMSGNVWEWCSDLYGSYSSAAVTNPEGHTSRSLRVVRGGSWGNIPQNCRVSRRYNDNPDNRGNYIGFRLASSVQK